MARPDTVTRQAAEARGRTAEREAAHRFRAEGFTVLTERFRCELGEIDLIVQRGDLLAFVEVKRRSTHAAARLAVDDQTQQRICAAAVVWLATHAPDHAGEVRYDIVTTDGRTFYHHADAFRPASDVPSCNGDDLF